MYMNECKTTIHEQKINKTQGKKNGEKEKEDKDERRYLYMSVTETDGRTDRQTKHIHREKKRKIHSGKEKKNIHGERNWRHEVNRMKEVK